MSRLMKIKENKKTVELEYVFALNFHNGLAILSLKNADPYKLPMALSKKFSVWFVHSLKILDWTLT